MYGFLRSWNPFPNSRMGKKRRRRDLLRSARAAQDFANRSRSKKSQQKQELSSQGK